MFVFKPEIIIFSEMKYRFLIILLSINIIGCSEGFAQTKSVSVSGTIRDRSTKNHLPYVNVVIRNDKDSSFVTGTVTDDEGSFTLAGVRPGNYLLFVSYVGYYTKRQSLFVGSLSEYLDLSVIELTEDVTSLKEVVVSEKQDDVSSKMDKKTYIMDDNISQSGGSVLQTMQSLPGVTVQDGKIQLRGNDRITILIDGRQTAITGFGNQTGLDNIPSSAIEKIEIINNPSSKYDANGNAGIINIVMKKSKQEGLHGKIGLSGGMGALWVRKENLPDIRPQYTRTPKINPFVSLNYRKRKINFIFQADNLYTQTLNKNEFVTRTYSDGKVINQQLKRNRNTNFLTTKAGLDWFINDHNMLTVSGLFGSEKIIDRGDQPVFHSELPERQRLWQFLEDELKTTVMATVNYERKFKQAGHLFLAGFNYTFHREDEKYFYDNYLPTSTGTDAFALISDEQVYDLNLDYTKPLRFGRIETGIKFRYRIIPTDMNFIPGINSVLDTNAGGWADYKEWIPAAYGNYVYENKKIEAEIGLRTEYVKIDYVVNPTHNTYKSDGYDYVQPFPNMRVAYKLNEKNKVTLFYNRRVDRPNEVDIRIFPKYDDAEIIKVGNPALRPQFSSSIELGFKKILKKGYFYSAVYQRYVEGTITRISTSVPNDKLIYAIFQNAGKSRQSGAELIFSQNLNKWYTFNLNGTFYYNQMDAFTVENLYPVRHFFTMGNQTAYSGNIKWNNKFNLSKNIEMQLVGVYLAPDVISQGIIDQRFSIDCGIKKSIKNGRGELFFNATDLLNTMVIRKEIQSNGFSYVTSDYYETQVFRIGCSIKL